jgi:hypothetical protein
MLCAMKNLNVNDRINLALNKIRDMTCTEPCFRHSSLPPNWQARRNHVSFPYSKVLPHQRSTAALFGASSIAVHITEESGENC